MPVAVILDGGERAKMLIFRSDTQFPFVNNGKCVHGQNSIALSTNIHPAGPVCAIAKAVTCIYYFPGTIISVIEAKF